MPALAQTAATGAYLTDEVFLFRVVRVLPSEAGDVVELEDCHRLDVVRVPIGALRARCLRAVTPTPSDSASVAPERQPAEAAGSGAHRS
jgi:hypothetical protein